LCQVVLVGAFSIINDEDIIYVTGVEQYLFGIYEGSDVDMFLSVVKIFLLLCLIWVSPSLFLSRVGKFVPEI